MGAISAVENMLCTLQQVSRLLCALVLVTLSSAAPLSYCGGRGVKIPMLGEYSFWLTVQADLKHSSFAFRSDKDLHVSWCYPNMANFETGQITQPAPCFSEVLSKYQLQDYRMDVSGMPERLVLSATAAPMGMALGTFEVQLSQDQCDQQQLNDMQAKVKNDIQAKLGEAKDFFKEL